MSEQTPEQVAADFIAAAKAKKSGANPRKAKPPHVNRGEGAALLDSVYDFLSRFIVYPSDHAHVAHVLWIAHTHLMSAWESTPRIAFLSP